MKIVKRERLPKERVVECPRGGFVSHRLLLHDDNMGYTVTETEVHPGVVNRWHYKHHLESCYCVSGEGVLVDEKTNEQHRITPGTMYVLDKHDPHTFEALELTTLICVFNPPLSGREIHDADDSYPADLSPVYFVKRVPTDKVVANDYNPNKVAPPEMELLRTSIMEDGYTQPIVTFYDDENDKYIVVDGFHRYMTLMKDEQIREREGGHMPIVVIAKELGDRMASTIRHNRARGTHNIELMSVIVAELVEMGKSDRWISKHVGMSKDEVLRLKQITGLAALFKNQDFSDSWDAEDYEENTEIH